MKAIVLAGGKGTRLGKVAANLPKPLALIQGQPFIHILLRFLTAQGISGITLSVFHLSEKFEEELPRLKEISNSISLLKEPAPMGTGGAARFAVRNLPPQEHVLVLNGDSFFDFDLRAFVQRHENECALALKKVEDASRYGTVELSEGKVSRYAEKVPLKRAGLIYSGLSILKVADILSILPDGPSSLEIDFFPGLLRSGKAPKGEVFPGSFIDIGIPEDYEFANTKFNFSRYSNTGPAST